MAWPKAASYLTTSTGVAAQIRDPASIFVFAFASLVRGVFLADAAIRCCAAMGKDGYDEAMGRYLSGGPRLKAETLTVGSFATLVRRYYSNTARAGRVALRGTNKRAI